MTGTARRLAAGAAVVVLSLTSCANSEGLSTAGADAAEQEPTPRDERPDEPTEPAQPPEPVPSEPEPPQVEPRPDSPRPGPTMPLPNVVGRLAAFTLPSGNIGCRLVATEARCDIAERSYRQPPKPPSCDLDYGSAVSVVVGSRKADFICHGDTVLGARRTLQYGQSTVVGDVGCTSSEQGVYCYDLRSGTGFQLQREAARFF